MRVAAIVPAFNEQERVLPVVEESLHHVERVFVVDDGSDPVHRAIFSKLPSGTTVLRHRINLGKGAAMTTGIAAAQRAGFEAVVLLDSDGQHRPDEIPKLLGALEQRNLDIVFGARRINKRMPLMMRLGNRFFTMATFALFHIYLSDTQSGFRAFRTSAFDKLAWESPRYAAETEMVVNAGKHSLRYAEVPISTIYHDKYKGTTVFDGMRIFIDMLLWRISA